MDTLIIAPNPVLRRVNTTEEVSVETLLRANSVRERHNGVAIAANQIGLNGRWWVMQTDLGVEAIVDPQIELVGPFTELWEGCLSLYGRAKVKRATSVRIKGRRIYLSGPNANSEKEFDEVWTGLPAHIAQHEFDHLEGVLFLDKLSSSERSRIKGEHFKKLKTGLI